MKIFCRRLSSNYAGALLFVCLLVAVAVYYWHGMAAYVSPMMTPDEFGYVSVAAFLNGHDWTAVARGVPWYSYGYSLLLAPLFAITSAEHWYRDAQALNVALIVVLGICANLFLRKIDRGARPWLRHVVVAVILLYPSLVFYARLAWAETLIAVLPWLLGLLVYRVFEASRRYLDAFLCGALLMASYYIHARLIVLVAAGLLVFAFMAVKAGRKREFGMIVLGMLVALVPAYWFKGFLIDHLYGGAVVGTQDSPLKMLVSVWHRIGDAAAWRDFVGSAAGQFIYLVIATLGLAIAGLAALLRRLRHSYGQSGWAEFAALAFILLGAAGCYALVLMTMGISVGYPHHVFYGRYTEPLVLPIAAMGLLYLCRTPKRALLWMAVAFAIACALVPVAADVAASLPNQTTYWTLITGLFTYRTTDWRLAAGTLLVGFFWVAIVLSVAFRVHRYAGLAMVAVLFLCADYGLLTTYASATSAHVAKWQTWTMPAPGGRQPATMRLEMQGGDPLRLRARIQVINAVSTVIPAEQWPKGFSGTYEQMVWNGKQVTRSECLAPGRACTPLAAPPEAMVRLSIRAGRSLGVRHAFLSGCARQFLDSLPYLRAVWDLAALQHVALNYQITAPKAQGITIKVFVTRRGEKQWLADRQIFLRAKAGQERGVLRVPVPVRTYSGAALPAGVYTFGAVVAASDGNNWSTITSIPMRIK